MDDGEDTGHHYPTECHEDPGELRGIGRTGRQPGHRQAECEDHDADEADDEPAPDVRSGD